MLKTLSVFTSALVVGGFVAGSAMADPSAKFAAQTNSAIQIIEATGHRRSTQPTVRHRTVAVATGLHAETGFRCAPKRRGDRRSDTCRRTARVGSLGAPREVVRSPAVVGPLPGARAARRTTRHAVRPHDSTPHRSPRSKVVRCRCRPRRLRRSRDPIGIRDAVRTGDRRTSEHGGLGDPTPGDAGRRGRDVTR